MTTWKRMGHGPAHIVTKTGAGGNVTACRRVIPKTAEATVTRWVEGKRGHYYTRPVDGETCPDCEQVAEMAEI